jgi:hypothetical protein
MGKIIRQVPAVIGAVAAYIIIRLIWWLLGMHSIAGEVLIVVVVAFLVALFAERAMRKYQQTTL